MQIKINIDAQHLTLSSNKIVSGTNNFVECAFTFSADWGELDKWALFKRGKNTYEMYIEDNLCVIPSQCISEQGEIIMSVVGRSDGKNITATAEDKLLVIAGRAFDGEDEERLTTTYLEETLGLVQNIRGQVVDSSDEAATQAARAAASAEAAESSAKRSERAAAGVQTINDQLDQAEALAAQTQQNANAAKKAAAQAQTAAKSAAQSESNAASSASVSKTNANNAILAKKAATDSATAAALSEKKAKEYAEAATAITQAQGTVYIDADGYINILEVQTDENTN